MDTESKTTFEKKRDELERTLTDEEINNLLQDYAEVDDPTTIEIDTHVRYFTIVFDHGKATKVFRLGGKLFSISPDGDYLILKHGNNVIQAKVENTIFYKQLSISEIKKEYEEILDKYEDEIIELKQVNRKLYEKLTNKDTSMKSRSYDRAKRIHDIENYVESRHSSRNKSAQPSAKLSAMSTTKLSETLPMTKMEMSESYKYVRL